MKKQKVATGIYWVEIPGPELRILCGSPADSVKHLMQRGFIGSVERGGTSYETGPNAILLSEIPIQNGEFANLAEFPVLQMLYRQGMMIPGHPNNTGRKPLIIGSRDQVNAQREYIYRGNYGLVNEAELTEAGYSPEMADELMRIKKEFAFGTIRDPEELIDFVEVGNDPVELAPKTYVERVAINTYRISHQGDYEEVSLNLQEGEHYAPPYSLGSHRIKNAYFSVIHTGEGNGWDTMRPCMASMVSFQGKTYLIDAGPNVLYSLRALGISVNEIAGIFHTHAHDDHFAGLTSLVRADHRIPYYATKAVRHSVMKKLSALMSFPEDRFEEFFVPVDLTEGEWNRVDGMEVLPAYSPHPVDTTILFFRALCKEGFKTYAHFADIASFEVLKKLKKGAKSALGKEIDRRIRETYLSPANLKKIDAGGGMIHGNAEDFRQDDSDKIVLSHIDRPLTLNEKEIGSNSSFGMQDILIRREHSLYDPLIPRAVEELYPSVPKEEREVLENCPVRMYTVGSIIIKRGAANDTVYLLLKGLVELIAAELDIRNVLNPGALFGEYSAYSDTPSDRTYRADSFVLTLEIPSHLYRLFLERSGLVQRAEKHLPRKHFLQSTPLFGDSISGALQDRMASYLREKEFGNKKKVKPPKESCLFLVEKGAVDIKFNGKKLDTVIRGGYFGEDQVLGNPLFEYETVEDTQLFCIPASALEEVPIVRWKLLESLNKRIRIKDAIFPV